MRKRTTKMIPAALGALALMCGIARAELQVASVFGNGMILQRGRSVPVWGAADAGSKISVTFAGQTKQADTDKRGRWSVALDPMPASVDPRSLTVQTSPGEQRITIENVLVGDVWLLLTSKGGALGWGADYGAPVPLNRVTGWGDPKNDAPNSRPQERMSSGPGSWNVSGGHTGRNGDNAFAYFFGKRIHRVTGVPVGTIVLGVGDLDAMISRSGYRAMPSLKALSDRVEAWFPSTPQGQGAFAPWIAEAKDWIARCEQALAANADMVPSQAPIAPASVDDRSAPTALYNTIVAPMAPFAVKGAVYYDIGAATEYDSSAAAGDPLYPDKIQALAAGLRADLGIPDLPLCIGQQQGTGFYAKDGVGSALDMDTLAGHRDRQRRAAMAPHMGLVVTLDIDALIRPTAERFAQWALADVYSPADLKAGARAPVGMGPMYKSHVMEGRKAFVSFEQTGSGLMAAHKPYGKAPIEDESGALAFFALAGSDGIWHMASATVDPGDKHRVVVFSDYVPEPIHVRYAHTFSPRGLCLYNREGLPASPFTSDDAPAARFSALYEKHFNRNRGELGRSFCDPGDLESLAVSKALAECSKPCGKEILALLSDKNPEARCGGLRTLGYLYWNGPVPDDLGAYRNVQPGKLGPEGQEALEAVCKLADDPEFWVRYCAVEALAMIGSHDPAAVDAVVKLAGDEHPMVNSTAVRAAKLRLQTFEQNNRVINAVFGNSAETSGAAMDFAFGLFGRYSRWEGEVNWDLVNRCVEAHDGNTVGDHLWGVLRPMEYMRTNADYMRKSVPSLLHMYVMGWYRDRLETYGGGTLPRQARLDPAPFKARIQWLRDEIGKLERAKPEGWEDIKVLYETAVDGIERILKKAEDPQLD